MDSVVLYLKEKGHTSFLLVTKEFLLNPDKCIQPETHVQSHYLFYLLLLWNFINIGQKFTWTQIFSDIYYYSSILFSIYIIADITAFRKLGQNLFFTRIVWIKNIFFYNIVLLLKNNILYAHLFYCYIFILFYTFTRYEVNQLFSLFK